MELEGSNVFRGYAVQGFINEVSEFSRVVSVRVDGSLSHIADFEILSESYGQRARSSFVRSHVVFLDCLDRNENRAEAHGITSVKLPVARSASATIVLIVNWSRKCSVRIVVTGWSLHDVCVLTTR